MNPPEWPSLAQLPLDPTVDEWQHLAAEVQRVLAQLLTNLGSQPARSDAPPEPWEEATSLDTLLPALIARGFDPGHPGFMAYIPGGGLVTSALAEWFIRTANRYGTAHFATPDLADLEHRVVQTFAAWVGYDERSAGVLTTGGSLANFTAVVTARRARLPENFLNGVMYCSEQTHHSVMKAANLAGFSSRNVRLIPTDDAFRLRLDALDQAISEDLAAGLTPFLVVASAGTTNTGSIDPLVGIAERCREHGLWYHVDAAYGGAFLLTQAGQDKLSGIEHADSVTLDPHKGLFLPYGTGCIVVKDREALISAHEMRGDYMPDLDRARAHLDPFSLSVELSREHRGLKVALPFMLHGVNAFRDALEEKLELARQVYDALSAEPRIRVLNAPELTTVAFRLIEPDTDAANQALLERINAGGRVYLSGTQLCGGFALRVSILNHRTHEAEISTLLSELEAAIPQMQNRS